MIKLKVYLVIGEKYKPDSIDLEHYKVLGLFLDLRTVYTLKDQEQSNYDEIKCYEFRLSFSPC